MWSGQIPFLSSSQRGHDCSWCSAVWLPVPQGGGMVFTARIASPVVCIPCLRVSCALRVKRFSSCHQLGLVVKRSYPERATCARFRLKPQTVRSSHASDFKNDIPVATLPSVWRKRVSAGTGWPGVSTLWVSLIYDF